jgi:hypothetical protein
MRPTAPVDTTSCRRLQTHPLKRAKLAWVTVKEVGRAPGGAGGHDEL